MTAVTGICLVVAHRLCELTDGRTHIHAIGILTLKLAHTSRIEPRWPVALIVVAGCLLLALLPGRLTVFPAWIPYAVTVVFLVPMAALAIT